MNKQIAAEAGEVGRDLGRRPIADRHQGDDGGNPDDDAEHGEERPQQHCAGSPARQA
jgi:hypothetical protein